MNIVLLMGRLVRDPELRTSSSGISMCNFTIAVDRPYNKEQKADFIRCIAFKKTAETVSNYFKKGNKIIVDGSLQIDEYTNKDGQKVSAPGIMVNRIEFVESRAAKQEAPAQSSAFESFGPAMDDPDNIPF